MSIKLIKGSEAIVVPEKKEVQKDSWQVGWDDPNFPAFGLESFDKEDDAQRFAETLHKKGEKGIVLTKWENDQPVETWTLIDGEWE